MNEKLVKKTSLVRISEIETATFIDVRFVQETDIFTIFFFLYLYILLTHSYLLNVREYILCGS